MKKNKQERKFQTQWTTNRKWLVYSDEENKMYCTLCKNGNVDSVFTKGTNNIKLDLHMKRWDMGNYNDLEPDYVIMFTFP
jgi:hypothetical protein